MLLPCKTMRSRVSARVGESVEPGRVIRPALDQFGQCAHPGERPVGRQSAKGRACPSVTSQGRASPPSALAIASTTPAGAYRQPRSMWR